MKNSVHNMIFSEVYSAYFGAVAAILREAIQGDVSEKRMREIVNEKAFAESSIAIIPALKNEEWLLLNHSGQTPLHKLPHMPLTTLQKRWLKALLDDPRIALFEPDISGLADTDPLFCADDIVYFDRYSDGDPYNDSRYTNIFHTILHALRECRRLEIKYLNRNGRQISGTYNPWKLEYSSKDDKFRLLTNYGVPGASINVGRIISCEMRDGFDPAMQRETSHEASLTFELTDERNALERVMLHFSDCRKETRRLDDKHYNVILSYDLQDETEILIRILSFGPMIRVIAPESFINLIKERVKKQQSLSKCE